MKKDAGFQILDPRCQNPQTSIQYPASSVQYLLSYNKPLTLKRANFSLICRGPISNLWIMANYLLLRNNKESGPYSLDDLMKLGLKAYDLLWVQGKSAAWRYPSEIDEIKSFAPVVEEQPFDRFYKKEEAPTEEKKIVIAPPVAEVKYEAPPVVESTYKEPIVEARYEKYIPKKSVAVTMPGQKAMRAEQSAKPLPQPTKEETPVTEPSKPTITVSENPSAAQIKYSQPLDEIKEMYVKTLQDRKQKIARRGFWLKSMKQAAAILGLVAIGVVAGFIIKPGKNKQAVVNSPVEKQSQAAALQTEPNITGNTDPKTDSKSLETSTKPVEPIKNHPNGGYVNKLPEVQDKAVEPKQQVVKSPVNNKKDIATTKPENVAPATSFAPQNAETNAATGERSRKVRDTNSEIVNNASNTSNDLPALDKKTSSTGELGSLVTVKSNNYKKVAFGGIRDLQLTVVNDSKYILENVTVELQYIKPNELPLKTENIEFNSVAPNATSTIRVPDTNRGIRVVFRITRIKKRAADERVADN